MLSVAAEVTLSPPFGIAFATNYPAPSFVATSIFKFSDAYSASDQTDTCFHTALCNRCRDLTHSTKLIIFKSLLDFGMSVHHKRAAADYRLGNGFSVHHQKPGGRASRHLNAASGPRENGEVAFRGISLAIHYNFTTQDEKGTCMPIG